MNDQHILDGLEDIKAGLCALVRAAANQHGDPVADTLWIGERVIREVDTLVGEIRAARADQQLSPATA